MDVVLINASPYELPSSLRAGAIAYDGTLDLGVWRPPGPDRDFMHAYGETLTSVLAKERTLLPEGRLQLGQALRVLPGKLRCDYVIWLASREAHGETTAAPAPNLELVQRLAESALALAAKHGTPRVAFGALGAGTGAADAAERMAAVARGADAYRTACLARGAQPAIEEVLICSPSAADVAKARRLTQRLTKQAPAPQTFAASAGTSAGAGRAKPSASRGASSASSRLDGARAASALRKARGKRLDPSELASARTRAAPYDRGRAYIAGEWFIHPSFGTGQVQAVLGPEKMMMVLFEDGEERRLIHGRV